MRMLTVGVKSGQLTTNSFLDGQALGPGPSGQNYGEFAPFMGMEQFFLPTAVDNRLGGQSVIDQNPTIMSGFDPNLLAEDLWW